MTTFSAPLLERSYSAVDVVEQRARIRAKVAPRRGVHGLDIGYGPGLLACELARDVGPSGRMVGIDQSSDRVAMSAGRAEFAVGDAMVNLHSDDTTYSGSLIDVVARFVGPKGGASPRRWRRPGRTTSGARISWGATSSASRASSSWPSGQ